MNKNYINELINMQNTFAHLLLEESLNKKTAKEVADNNTQRLLIAAYEAVNKVLHHYLVKF